MLAAPSPSSVFPWPGNLAAGVGMVGMAGLAQFVKGAQADLFSGAGYAVLGAGSAVLVATSWSVTTGSVPLIFLDNA